MVQFADPILDTVGSVRNDKMDPMYSEQPALARQQSKGWRQKLHSFQLVLKQRPGVIIVPILVLTALLVAGLVAVDRAAASDAHSAEKRSEGELPPHALISVYAAVASQQASWATARAGPQHPTPHQGRGRPTLAHAPAPTVPHHHSTLVCLLPISHT
jgi:hypothetical protein